MARDRKTASDFFGWLLYFAIASWVAEGFKISYWKALLIVFGITFLVVLSVIGVSSLLDWGKKFRRCAHGVRLGAAGACQSCTSEWQRQLEARNQQATERERLAKIKLQAETLRGQEIDRLSKAWLSNAEAYYSMTPRQFEDAIAQLFRKLGYTVQQTPYTNDSGKDAILLKDGRKALVECKRYSQFTCIGRPDMQKFAAAMHDEAATEGFYVNTGRFSPEAKKYAAAHGITVYDRFTFPSLVIEAYPIEEDARTARTMCLECGAIVLAAVQDSPVSETCPTGHKVTNALTRASLRVFTPTGVPCCEKCGSSMRIVKGYRGQFWGCSRYPRCRFTRKLSQ